MNRRENAEIQQQNNRCSDKLLGTLSEKSECDCRAEIQSSPPKRNHRFRRWIWKMMQGESWHDRLNAGGRAEIG